MAVKIGVLSDARKGPETAAVPAFPVRPRTGCLASLSALDVGRARRHCTTGGYGPTGARDPGARSPITACGLVERPPFRPPKAAWGWGGRSNRSSGGRHVARPNRTMPGKQTPPSCFPPPRGEVSGADGGKATRRTPPLFLAPAAA